MENVVEDASPEFEWLKKKGVGGKNKDVQFYESFLYDGVKYTLYDCVYMYKEGLQEPYIGKLTKIWGRPGNIKKVKVHWFFRPEEISKWLGDTKTLENEIFFASGEGHGLANINSPESIAGPCNVVCLSTDCRNRQPSAEELKAADFVFYRTFDVRSCTILDKIDDKVGDLEIKYIFNQKEGEIHERNPETKEDGTTSSEPQQPSTAIATEKLQHDPNSLKRNITPTESDKLDDRPLKKLKPGGTEEKLTEPEVAQDSEKLTGVPSKKFKVDNTNKIQVDVNNLKGVGTSGTNSEMGKTNKANKDDMNVSIPPVDNNVENKERNKAGGKNPPEDKRAEPKAAQDSEKLTGVPSKKFKADNTNKMQVDVNDLKGVGTSGTKSETGKTEIANKDDRNVSIVPVDQPLKKQKSGVKNPAMVDNKSKHEEKLPADVNNLKDLGISGATEEKLNQKNGKVSSKVTDDSGGKIIKKSTEDGSAKLPNNKKLGNSGSGKDLVANSSFAKGKSKSGLALDSTVNDKESKEEQSSEGKIIRNSKDGGSAKPPDNKKLGNSGSGKDLVANSSLAKGKSKSGLALDSTVNDKESKEEQSSEGKIIKNLKDCGSAKLPDNKKLGNSGSGKNLAANSSLPKEISKAGLALDSTVNDKESKEEQSSEGKIIKNSKDGGSAKLPDNRKLGNSGSGKHLAASSSSPKEKSKSGLAFDSTANNKESKEEQSNDNKRKLTMSKSFKASTSSIDKDKKSAYQEFTCGPKPNDEKNSWFKQLPWDERLKTAYDQGMAILLHNVDPDYTSSEIEDIIWHAFSEKCEAKIVQRTAVSSPHYGQAIILLRTKEAALKILVKLDKECLMLSNARPLVATICPPISTKKNSRFFGHLVLDKIKLQNQRDVEEAVSTSHFSQPNTIVYDLAMDWCLLQSRSKKIWDKLHKLQGVDLKSLEPNRVQK